MGSSGTGGSDSYDYSDQNVQFEQLKHTAQHLFTYLDALIELGKKPSLKLLGFICNLADGEFVRNEDLEQYKELQVLLNETLRELEHVRLENEALQKELALLKEGEKERTVNPQTFDESVDRISETMETVKDKLEKNKPENPKSIGGIVEFD